MLTTFYCIAKLKVCCHHVSKIGDFSSFELSTEMAQEALIDKCAKYHAETLDLIETTSVILEYINLAEILTCFGFFAVMTFLIHLGRSMGVIVYVFLFIATAQLFIYCYLSELVSTKIKFIIYKCKIIK